MTTMTYDQVQTQLRRNRAVLNTFLPQTQDERLSKLRDRLGQAWPVFGRHGLGGKFLNQLHIQDHEAGSVVRFFDSALNPTFHPIGAVKHGASWWLSEPIDGKDKMSNSQMQTWLEESQLNWVVVI